MRSCWLWCPIRRRTRPQVNSMHVLQWSSEGMTVAKPQRQRNKRKRTCAAMPLVFRIHLAYARARTNMPRKHISYQQSHIMYFIILFLVTAAFFCDVAGLAIHCLPNEWIGLRWFGNVTVANSRRLRRQRQQQRSAHLSLSQLDDMFYRKKKYNNTSMVRRARMRYSPHQAIFRVVSQAFRVFVERKRYSVVLCTPSVAASSHWICVERACDFFFFPSVVESNVPRRVWLSL